MISVRTIGKVLAVVVLCGATALAAADYDFSGTFTYDNDVLQCNFAVHEDSDVTIFSSSWDEGGFDPIVALWDAGGNQIRQQDDGENVGSTMSNGVSYDHGNWDAYFTEHLAAGDYIATIAQYDNVASGTTLAAGFEYDGNPNFTFDLGYGTRPYFNGVADSSDARTSEWAFHILNVGAACIADPTDPEDPEDLTIPAPSAILLGSLGMGMVSWLRRRRTE